MNIQQLTIFVSIVELKTLRKVAEHLNIQQPTVHFHIKKLEQQYPFPLFKSNYSKTLALTNEGTILYQQAKQILMLVDKTNRLMGEYSEKRSGSLLLGSTYTPATYMILPTLRDFKQNHSDAYLSVEVKPAPILLEKIKNFEIDMAIVSHSDLMDKDIVAEKLLKDDLQLILHPNDPLTKKRNLTVKDFSNQPFILHEKGSISRKLIDEWISENNICLKELMELSSTETMKEAVKNELGMAIVSESCFKEEKRKGELVSRALPAFQLNRHIYITYHKKQIITPIMESFLHMLKNNL
ncbi:LysR family transcriptional regulator [Gracilibacillus sp. S3-1-1]|uniref:LysR family transcriptional regulator n=1 Tax=Gracilibacillus pellucidus TaxID=3095368 RepID=A0ACC6M6B3_9BACI|nr:LysR family transcriptional regulator [Gracilibacillus sp. S3-1-1]MDX8046506.1 LysR family transcriptional regulator [Gracilibacillus sp. S3-1-1]